jgi:YkoY family integral membrane protein
MWGLELADLPTILMAIGTLVVLEGLLSADNALVLAVMVRRLPNKGQQKKALRYGIWGAFAFRLIAIITASWLLQFWELKVVGGLYLLVLAIRHLLFDSGHDESEAPAVAASNVSPTDGVADLVNAAPAPASGPKMATRREFWTTVFHVEMADIAFSVDSILAAMALARGLPQHLQDHEYLTLAIVYLGGILGIITMRYVAGVFLVLLDRFKGLAAGAYFLVAWIGLKLIGGGLHDAFNPKLHNLNEGWRRGVPEAIKTFPWEVHDPLFWGGMATIVVLSLLYKPRGGPSSAEMQQVDDAADHAADFSADDTEPTPSEPRTK